MIADWLETYPHALKAAVKLARELHQHCDPVTAWANLAPLYPDLGFCWYLTMVDDPWWWKHDRRRDRLRPVSPFQ